MSTVLTSAGFYHSESNPHSVVRHSVSWKITVHTLIDEAVTLPLHPPSLSI